MHKVTKRALALLLACTLVFSSGMRSRSYAMAGGGVIAGGGAVIGAETALAYLLGILGLSAASAAVYDNRDSIARWGKTQLTNLSNWVSDRADDLSVTVSSMQSWLEKAGKGTVSTATNEWKALKGWVASQYAAGGKVDTVINSQEDFPVTDNVAAIGSWASWDFLRGTYTDNGVSYEQYRCYELSGDTKNALFFTVAASYGAGTIYLIGAISLSPGTRFTSYYKDVYLDGSEKEKYKTSYGITEKVSSVSEFYYTGLDQCENGKECTMPNFVGNLGTFNTWSEALNSKELRAKAAVAAYSKYLAGDFDVPKTKVYTETGGISSAYEKGKTLENIDIVGVGAKAGATDVTIPWPKDNTFGGLIGGAITGTNTWTDVIDAAGVGVISRENEKDYVIDNTGVTTKEWDYATDIPGTGDTDKPGTDAGDTDADVSKDLGDYTFAGLEKIFPFCLPFDLIDFIGVLDADPEAPKFTIPIKVPTSSGWGVYNIDIDLSKFDSVAALLRQMETLAFVVGLIMITRQKMIRG